MYVRQGRKKHNFCDAFRELILKWAYGITGNHGMIRKRILCLSAAVLVMLKGCSVSLWLLQSLFPQKDLILTQVKATQVLKVHISCII